MTTSRTATSAPAAPPIGIGPAPAVTGARGATLRHTWVHALRLVRTWSRRPAMLVQAVLFPAALLLVLDLVFSTTVSEMAPGTDPLTRSVPLVAMMGGLYGTLAAAMSLDEERESGLIARFWSLPGEQIAAPAGRAFAEAVRTIVSTVAVLVVGVALGLHFADLPSALVAILIPAGIVAGAIPLVTILVLRWGPAAVRHCTVVTMTLSFFNPGIAPIEAFPGWMRPFVEHQPFGVAVEAMRGLLAGGPIGTAGWETLAWVVLGIVTCTPAAAVSYRRAATA